MVFSPPSGAVGHESVELYLYSTYGPYGLYRALVPVQVQGYTCNISIAYSNPGFKSVLNKIIIYFVLHIGRSLFLQERC